MHSSQAPGEAADRHPAQLLRAAGCYLLWLFHGQSSLSGALGSAAAHRTQWGSDDPGLVAQSTQQALGQTPGTAVRPGSLPPRRQDGATLPDGASLCQEPFGRSDPPEKPNASQHQSASGLRALGIHPCVSPESSVRAFPCRLLRGRSDQPCSSHGDAPMKVSALPGKPLWGGLSSSTPVPRAPYRHPSRRCGVRRASCSGSPRPRESTLIERQTSLNINGLGVMFIAVTRGGAGLPPAFGKEAWEGRAGCAPTVPASGESWAPWSCGWPYSSWGGSAHHPLLSKHQANPSSPPAAEASPRRGAEGWARVQAATAFCWREAAGTPRPHSLALQVPHGWSVPPSPELSHLGAPAAPRHGHVCAASLPGNGYRDAAPHGAALVLGSEASCQAGCSIQFALIWQSGSGSHAPKPIRAAVAGGNQRRGVLPSQCPGLEECGRLVLRIAQLRCRRVKPSPGRVLHGATLLSRSRDAAQQPLG